MWKNIDINISLIIKQELPIEKRTKICSTSDSKIKIKNECISLRISMRTPSPLRQVLVKLYLSHL